ncbi:rhomboid-like protein [Kocuria sp.]|uniref:rhomboid-like protein n=1 Tax=Kocuria sp. TaxID=1871328 RepID=UPI0026DF1C05|nr:rhomboid-like protein [Kocuria sp.]MDO5619790.1 hypothetical protein [Kocuria sp.]
MKASTPVRSSARRLLRDVLTSDIALGYAAIVLGVFLFLRLYAGGVLQESVVAAASTNLDNLQADTFTVLLYSAFVVENASGLLLLPVLVVAYSVAQHRLGRLPLLVTLAIGHVLATLFVAPLLVHGIQAGFLPQSITHVTDVGFSYGLAAVTGLLVCTIRGRWRRAIYTVLVILAWSWVIILGPILHVHLVRPSFTDVGHTIALFTGLALSTLPGSGQRASRAQFDTP